MSKYKIYCDMDGVLTDFDKAYEQLTGEDIRGQHLNGKSFWEPIDKAGVKFWSEMKWRSDGKELWDYIKDYKPKILSAPSREDSSRVGKHQWVERELLGVPLLLRTAKHKKDFSDSNSILIDDRLDNIEGWREKGGIGIHHTSTKDTINQLKKLGL
jgi:FMN phosphatase YigB (HAD superfamily)